MGSDLTAASGVFKLAYDCAIVALRYSKEKLRRLSAKKSRLHIAELYVELETLQDKYDDLLRRYEDGLTSAAASRSAYLDAIGAIHG